MTDDLRDDEGTLKELMQFWADVADENRDGAKRRENQLVVRELRDGVDKLDAELNDDVADEQIQRRIDELGGLVVELELNRRADSENQQE